MDREIDRVARMGSLTEMSIERHLPKADEIETTAVTISSGTVDITPERPLSLGGYAKRCSPFTGIADRLEANVLVLGGENSRAIVVSMDLLYPGEALRTSLSARLGADEAWPGLFLSASHTHFAPMTCSSMPHLGPADSEYIRFVADRVASLINSLESRRTATLCSYHEGTAQHSMNRRSIGRRLTASGLVNGARWGPNPTGSRDETVRLLKFYDPDSTPLAIIWNYACHPNCFPKRRLISAEYPGVVRSRLRQRYGDVPILFLQGFCGDVRPPFLGASGIKGVARRILFGPQFRIPRLQEWELWSAGLASAVEAAAESPSRKLRLRAPQFRRVEMAEQEFAVGGDGDKSLFWHVIDCGAFKIVGINAEPVVEYRRLLERYVDQAPVLSVGCLDQTHCYLPVDRMVAEGGYEVDGFRRLLSFNARFRNQLQESVLRRLKEALL